MKRLARQITIFLLATAFFVVPIQTSVQAQSASELLERIEALLAQIEVLELRLERQRGFEEEERVTFRRPLTIGSEGEDVGRLQELLSQTSFYPEGLVTSYYGPLTAAAVERLQARYLLPQTGVYGIRTASVLRERFELRANLDEVQMVVEENEETDFSSDRSVEDEDEQLSVDEQYADNRDLEGLALLIQNAVNDEREARDLGRLRWDEELAVLAFNHNLDQRKDNEDSTEPALFCQYPFIRHEGRVGFRVSDRARLADISYRAIGENIAMIPVTLERRYTIPSGTTPPDCPTMPDFVPEAAGEEAFDEYFERIDDFLETVPQNGSVRLLSRDLATDTELVERAVEGWMDSPGHRANILSDAFGRAGVGITQINDYLIITQNFKN